MDLSMMWHITLQSRKTQDWRWITSVVVHRKGATRAFPANRDEVPKKYRDLGQPVFIPGSMGTASWILLGQPNSMDLTFGSTAHGAGRTMSRSKAKRNILNSMWKNTQR